MKGKIELVKAVAEGDVIRYEVRESPGLGLLRQEKVDLFIRYHFSEGASCDLSGLPPSILALPISIYMATVTWFYDVELVIPEMDKTLYDALPNIYAAYSKVYGPFKEAWRGKVTVGKVVENHPCGNPRYDKVVFFSGGVDACHAGIDNPGRRSLLVSIPDIECGARNEGALREEKFALIKNFAAIVNSDWLLITNNFNMCLFRDAKVNQELKTARGLSSAAFRFDGWFGIKYLPNMCSVAPVAYLTGVASLVMGGTFEMLEWKPNHNEDGANPALSDAITFANVSFAEQDALLGRRTPKVKTVIDWCKERGVRMKLWTCFSDQATQCGFCTKCVRTELNILCAGENPKDWGFDGFDERKFERHVRSYRYSERSPCWLWDICESVDDAKTYPFLDGMLHWLKRIGHREYARRVARRARFRWLIARPMRVWKYPHYVRLILSRFLAQPDNGCA